jgi:hypothetical protein
MCCLRKKNTYSVCRKKKTQKNPIVLDKIKRGVQDGSIHIWGTKQRKKKTLELS